VKNVTRVILAQLSISICFSSEIPSRLAFADTTAHSVLGTVSKSTAQSSDSSVGSSSQPSESSIVNTSQASYPSETSHRAWDFLNSLGINLDMSQPCSRYNVNAIVSDLSYVGLKHVRGTIGSFSIASNAYYTNNKWVMPTSFTSNGGVIPVGSAGANSMTSQQMLQMLASVGVHIDPDVYLKDPKPYQSWLDASAPYIEYIEGPNEVNLEPTTITYDGLTRMAAGVAVQKVLYNLVKSDPKLSSIPVYAMTIGDSTAKIVATAGNIAPYADYGNLHSYPGAGNPPHTFLAQAMAVTTDAPGKPLVMTETGYPTAVYNTTVATTRSSGANIVSEDIQSKYLFDAVFDAFNLGYVKTYLFELIDYQCDPYYTNSEMHFGIFRCDNTPKATAIGLHNLHVILQDQGTGASTFTPTPLSYTLSPWLTDSAHNVNTYHTLLQKQNGTYDLVLWAEPNLWDDWSHTEITTGVPVNLITVSMRNSYQSIKIYDPIKSALPTTQVFNTNQIKVPVIDHPLIVEIGPKLD
jgi:hypothetical protein